MRRTTYYYGYYDTEENPITIDSSTRGNNRVTVYTKTSTDAVPASTTFVIKGLIAGQSTSIVIGNTKYTINVIAEDLSGVTPLAVQTWITNYAIESANKTSTSNAYWAASWGVGRMDEAYYVNVSAQDAYGEEGKPIAELAAHV